MILYTDETEFADSHGKNLLQSVSSRVRLRNPCPKSLYYSVSRRFPVNQNPKENCK